MGDISTDNYNSTRESELSSIIDRTSTVLKKGRVSSARQAWGTTSQAVGSTTSSSVGVATSEKTAKKTNSVLQDTTKNSRNKINSSPSRTRSSHKTSRSRVSQRGDRLGTSTSSTQSHVASLTKDLRRTVAEMEEELVAVKRSADLSKAQIVGLKDECLLYRDGVEHAQNQMNSLSQRGIRYELDIDNLKRKFVSMEEGMRQLQQSIQERSTRGEVNARVMASIDPLRNQMETALKAQAQAVATATATAMSAAHKAQASAELVESKSQFFLNDADRDISATVASSKPDHAEASSAPNLQMEIVESRIERRMERLLDDKVELSIARMKSKLEDDFKTWSTNAGQSDASGTQENTKTNNAVIDRVNEVYERVIALGGKLAEEAQRRGIINNQLRSEIRQMQTNIEKAMAPDDTIEDKITAAVAKAMVAERQDSRRLRAMESQQMSAELENVRSSLLKEI